jgi:quinoprotein glucose dehydrogenase
VAKFAVWLVVAILSIVGAALTAGGVILVDHGGSAYYVVTGIAVLLCALGLGRRAHYAAWSYGAMLAWTIVWSLWEVGLDDWALMPRMLGVAVVGLLFLLPFIHRATGASRCWVGAPTLAAFLVIGIAIVRAETAESSLASAARITPITGASTDWPHWGNTLAGTKYAASDQINLGNVGKLKLAWRYDSDIKPGALRSLEAAPLAVDGRIYMCIESGTVAIPRASREFPLPRMEMPRRRLLRGQGTERGVRAPLVPNHGSGPAHCDRRRLGQTVQQLCGRRDCRLKGRHGRAETR